MNSLTGGFLDISHDDDVLLLCFACDCLPLISLGFLSII